MLAAAGVLVTTGCGRTSPEAAPKPSAPTAAPAQGSTTTTTGSCVERYSLDNLEKRDYAFDGTVREIKPGSEDQPDRVTFDVKRWYKRGQNTSATFKAYGFTATTSAGGSPHEIGERLLVAGDDDYVWECGFTQPYDASVASEWETAFAS
jgi:hypothetical protein